MINISAESLRESLKEIGQRLINHRVVVKGMIARLEGKFSNKTYFSSIQSLIPCGDQLLEKTHETILEEMGPSNFDVKSMSKTLFLYWYHALRIEAKKQNIALRPLSRAFVENEVPRWGWLWKDLENFSVYWGGEEHRAVLRLSYLFYHLQHLTLEDGDFVREDELMYLIHPIVVTQILYSIFLGILTEEKSPMPF